MAGIHRSSVLAAAFLFAAGCLAGLSGCDRPEKTPRGRPDEAAPLRLTVQSTAFPDGKAIPKQHTADGADVSPPLTWSGAPAGTKELALIMDDPDAPGDEPWVHWVIYKIPADLKGLPEGLPRAAQLESPAGAMQGQNSWGTVGYRGPAPPSGVHHYHFKLYALDAALDVRAGLSKQALLDAMSGHILAEGKLVGTYQR